MQGVCMRSCSGRALSEMQRTDKDEEYTGHPPPGLTATNLVLRN
jgi:hypothetical protein